MGSCSGCLSTNQVDQNEQECKNTQRARPYKASLETIPSARALDDPLLHNHVTKTPNLVAASNSYKKRNHKNGKVRTQSQSENDFDEMTDQEYARHSSRFSNTTDRSQRSSEFEYFKNERRKERIQGEVMKDKRASLYSDSSLFSPPAGRGDTLLSVPSSSRHAGSVRTDTTDVLDRALYHGLEDTPHASDGLLSASPNYAGEELMRANSNSFGKEQVFTYDSSEFINHQPTFPSYREQNPLAPTPAARPSCGLFHMEDCAHSEELRRIGGQRLNSNRQRRTRVDDDDRDSTPELSN